jgi:mRNA-degrading endonuclease RelE of RelBE toxin-antitoxin system
VAEPIFMPAFLRHLRGVESSATKLEQQLLEQTLASIVADPYLPERFPTFYNPNSPTYFFRSGPFMIEFAVDQNDDRVTFVSLLSRTHP